MRHNDATVTTKRAPATKSRTGRPLSNPAVIAFSFMDAEMSLDDTLAKKLAGIKADIDEYNSWVRFRRNLRALSESVAA